METYYGYIDSVPDALLVLEACRLGNLHRVQRRLSEKERQRIRSGSIFVWEEEESGMRRWTDGRTWSPSRVHGSFLTYRELEGKRKSGKVNDTPSPTLPSHDSDYEGKAHNNGEDFNYKDDGMIKQSLSVTTCNGRKLHLISYFNKVHVSMGNLKLPSLDPFFSHVVIPKGLYPDISNEPNPTPTPSHHHHGSTRPSPSPLYYPHGSFIDELKSDLYSTAPYRKIRDHVRLPSPVSSETSINGPEILKSAIMSDSQHIPSDNNSTWKYNLPPPTIPYQDIRLDTLPNTEDRRQLAVLSTVLSL